jgi:hypothetical protein
MWVSLDSIERAAKSVSVNEYQNRVCEHCGLLIYHDRDSGYWFHSGGRSVDGHNGLLCSPEMWEEGATRVYAQPSPIIPITETTVLALVEAARLLKEVIEWPLPNGTVETWALNPRLARRARVALEAFE